MTQTTVSLESFSLGSAAYAAKRAADVIWVVQNPGRLEYAALVTHLNDIMRTYGETDATISGADLDELKSIAHRFVTVFCSKDVTEAARLLNDILVDYTYPPRLSNHDHTAWHLHVDQSDRASWAEWFAASSALALATILAEKQRKPGGLCASPSCGRLFIDLGKGGTRRYCSPRCASRERVAAYRRVQKQPDQ